ncbi:Utp14-domain-containing protein [Ramicandelaber brevisporus]|nr:Utp14-domain-containing protein [Ramicandelaber brevisporus]
MAYKQSTSERGRGGSGRGGRGSRGGRGGRGGRGRGGSRGGRGGPRLPQAAREMVTAERSKPNYNNKARGNSRQRPRGGSRLTANDVFEDDPDDSDNAHSRDIKRRSRHLNSGRGDVTDSDNDDNGGDGGDDDDDTLEINGMRISMSGSNIRRGKSRPINSDEDDGSDALGSDEYEDEEIDSDDAFDSEDEEKFSHFKFRGSSHFKRDNGIDDEDDDTKPEKSSKSASKRRGILDEPESDQAENDSDDLDNDDDGLMDISEMLGSDGSDIEGSSKSAKSSKRNNVSARDLLGQILESDASDSDSDDGKISRKMARQQTGDDSDDMFSGEDGDSDDLDASDLSADEEDDEDDDIDIGEGGVAGGKVNKRSDADKIDSLDSFVSTLNKSSRGRKGAAFLTERAGHHSTESEFNLSSRGSGSGRTEQPFYSFGNDDNDDNGSSGLGIEDLLNSLDGQTGLAGVKKSAQLLGEDASDERSSRSSSLKKTQTATLSAPLPRRIADGIQREVAYKQTKKDVSEWQGAVKHHREVERLVFPLVQKGADADKAAMAGRSGVIMPSTSSLVGDMVVSTSLEQSVNAALVQAGQSTDAGGNVTNNKTAAAHAFDAKIQASEELEMAKLNVEDVIKKRNELRLMRELMFREEIKAKRIAKIKSKTYRKIHKKEKLKLQEQQSLSQGEWNDLDPEGAMDEEAKREMMRAQERMTLRHKNTGKWAKDMLKHGGRDDEDARAAINEQLRKGEELRRKIRDIGSDESSGAEDDGVEDDIDDAEFNGSDRKSAVARAAREIDSVLKDKGNDELNSKLSKGVWEMKFMQQARQRQQAETERLADDVKRELLEELQMIAEGSDSDAAADAAAELAARGGLSKSVSSTKGSSSGGAGRLTFGSAAALARAKDSGNSDMEDDDDDGSDGSDDEVDIAKRSSSASSSIRTSAPVEVSINKQTASKKPEDKTAETAANPWLTSADTTSSKNKKRQRGVDHDSSAGDKLAAKIADHQKKQKLTNSNEDGKVIINSSKALTASAAAADSDSDSDSDAEGGLDVSNVQIAHVKTPGALTQKDLVEMAFAEDDIAEEEFEQEKQMIIEQDAPKDVDVTLPGWGGWSGAGVSKKQQVNTKKVIIPAKLARNGVIEAEQRRDAGKKHVIINEKRNKHAAKTLLASNVPFPYENRAQYEQQLRLPVGREWNTNRTFHKNIAPRIATKAGRIINPLSDEFKTE